MTSKQQCTHVSAWVAERMPRPWCQQAEIERLEKLVARTCLMSSPVEPSGYPSDELSPTCGPEKASDE